MSGTRRTPIARQATLQVTPRAVELFERMEKARRARRAASCVPPGPYGHCRMECSICRTWWELQTQLCDELKLKPWQWPAVPINPWVPGSMRSREWEPDGDETLERWQILERARLAAVAASGAAQDASIGAESSVGTQAPEERAGALLAGQPEPQK